MKKTIIALSAAALIAAAPAALAQGVPGKEAPGQHRMISKKHHPSVPGYAPLREMQTVGSNKGYPGAYGYAPGAPGRSDRDLEASRQAGGGGGGGGGGGSGM
ncbi:hypothetical protein [Bradyrhizobium sp. AS23.2]|uniref:hypothetical protein n=1 Tax=Bradyrhizobium sp. AS23.2 TaxID=1680155 RepID=UPI00116140E8|nr:hypothetical protein [Bradyrhizobium sp. AS23.2]